MHHVSNAFFSELEEYNFHYLTIVVQNCSSEKLK